MCDSSTECKNRVPNAPKIKCLKSDMYIPELMLDPESDKLKLINAPLIVPLARSLSYISIDIPDFLLEPLDNDKNIERLYLNIN